MPNILLYLKQLEKLNKEPTFYSSLPYLELSNLKCKIAKYWIWIEDEEWLIFDPLPY